MTRDESDLKKGTCPKCGAQDIHAQHRAYWSRNFLPVGWWSRARICNYACVTCGYLESYIEPDDRKKVAQKWDRVAQAEPA
ncbi:hypothetical protein PX52LOC_06948 [Limnoglobus roseus]|uniref:Uncharacterized protein n=1 Tax=Limnoglobus roseus TaxID=2598579 RepID=A0A5C1ANZ0_9BACT|nr:hypothetical protein PX52LOC_06948 [Limnoglobus roseus]